MVITFDDSYSKSNLRRVLQRRALALAEQIIEHEARLDKIKSELRERQAAFDTMSFLYQLVNDRPSDYDDEIFKYKLRLKRLRDRMELSSSILDSLHLGATVALTHDDFVLLQLDPERELPNEN